MSQNLDLRLSDAESDKWNNFRCFLLEWICNWSRVVLTTRSVFPLKLRFGDTNVVLGSGPLVPVHNFDTFLVESKQVGFWSKEKDFQLFQNFPVNWLGWHLNSDTTHEHSNKSRCCTQSDENAQDKALEFDTGQFGQMQTKKKQWQPRKLLATAKILSRQSRLRGRGRQPSPQLACNKANLYKTNCSRSDIVIWFRCIRWQSRLEECKSYLPKREPVASQQHKCEQDFLSAIVCSLLSKLHRWRPMHACMHTAWLLIYVALAVEYFQVPRNAFGHCKVKMKLMHRAQRFPHLGR